MHIEITSPNMKFVIDYAYHLIKMCDIIEKCSGWKMISISSEVVALHYKKKFWSINVVYCRPCIIFLLSTKLIVPICRVARTLSLERDVAGICRNAEISETDLSKPGQIKPKLGFAFFF